MQTLPVPVGWNGKMITLTNKDVVRHPLVQKIILAYEKFESRKRSYADGKKDNRWGRA